MDAAAALLAAGARLDAVNEARSTPLHLAASSGARECVDLVLARRSKKKPADVVVDAPDRLGRTALHYAARRGRDAFAKVLLRRGADPRVLNGRGQTAFDVAVDVHGAIRDEDLLIMLSAAQDDD